MTALNSQVRVQSRSGTVLNTISLGAFWSAVQGGNAFDPRVVYDPFNNRWILSSATDAPDGSISGATSSVLIGVSQTSDPTGNWFLYRVDADSSNTDWADYPTLGFNKNWIVVSVNMFPISSGANYVNIYAFNKTNLYAHGSGTYTLLQDTSGIGFTISPCVTFDNSLATEYLVEDYDNFSARLRISTINGAVGSEVLTLGSAYATASSSWDYGGEQNFLPQLGSAQKIDRGDSRILNCIYRNGIIWAAHTVMLPAANPSRAAAQWWQFLPSGEVVQANRIDDPTGTIHYAYPTIAVNTNDDALIGYSRFSASQYVSGNYSFRYATDPPGTLRDDTVLKAGEGVYYKTFGDVINRWGDYSATVVDPADDRVLWTLQEYAATPVGSLTNNSGRWGTWWGKINPAPNITINSADLVAETCTPTNGVIDPGEMVTVNFTLTNSGWATASNLVATLQVSGGITAPSAAQNYGLLAPGSSATRSFTFMPTGSCGGLVISSFALQDGTNSLGAISNSFTLGKATLPLSEKFDSVTVPALPSGWTTNFGGAWKTVTTISDSTPNAIFATNRASVSDARLTSPTFSITTTNAQITFRHNYCLEADTNSVAGYDGGVLEISTNAGATFVDILDVGASFVTNGYNRTIDPSFSNPLANRSAWSGSSGGFITTVVRLPASVNGKQVQLRWRLGADNSGSWIGWYVDSVNVIDGYNCCTSMVAPTILNPHASGTNFIFSFATVSGQSYVVEYKSALTTNQNWTTLQTLTGDGTTRFITNGVPLQRFYRIRSP